MKKLLIVFLFALLLTESAFAEKENLEQRCADLSKGSSYNYEVVYGKVTGIDIWPPHNVDCFPQADGSPTCSHRRKTIIYGLEQLLDSDQKIVAYTPEFTHPRGEALDREAYMKKNKKYKFCARLVNEYDFLPALTPPNLTIYKIDWVDTIQSY